jgi:hypothetical protein
MKRRSFIEKTVYLRRREDAELIAFLATQRNESEAIRAALRAYMNGGGDSSPTARIDPETISQAVGQGLGDIRAVVEAAVTSALAGLSQAGVGADQETDFEVDFGDDLLAD